MLTLAAVVYFLASQTATIEATPMLRWGWLLTSAAAVFAVGFFRGRIPRGAEVDVVRAKAIAIWAAAEASALIGLTISLLTGDLVPGLGSTVVGIGLMIVHGPASFR